MQADSVENLGVSGDFVVRSNRAIEIRVNVEDPRHAADTGENAVLLGKDGTGSALIGVHTGVAGGIARGPVLLQRVLDDGGSASAIPVHDGRWSFVPWPFGSGQAVSR